MAALPSGHTRESSARTRRLDRFTGISRGGAPWLVDFVWSPTEHVSGHDAREDSMKLKYAMKFVAEMDQSVALHRDMLGLKLRFQSPGWTEFGTGETTLALHPASANYPPCPRRRAQPGSARSGHRTVLKPATTTIRPLARRTAEATSLFRDVRQRAGPLPPEVWSSRPSARSSSRYSRFPAAQSSFRTTAGSSTASRRTCSPSRATATWNCSRATSRSRKLTRNEGLAPTSIKLIESNTES